MRMMVLPLLRNLVVSQTIDDIERHQFQVLEVVPWDHPF